MKKAARIEDSARREAVRRWVGIAIGWGAIFLFFASQWYVYDSSRGRANPFAFYLGWSVYMWTLTPLVVWFALRHPIAAGTWKRAVSLHLAASLLLTGLQLAIETGVGLLRHAHDLSLPEAMRHYFGQHTQLSLLSYWALIAAAMFYRVYDQARLRQLQSARLEASLAEARLAMLRMQLQPHFLFNTLQAATELIHEDPDGAEEILVRLSELLRVSLDELNVQEIPLSREIELLDCYMAIQERRFGDRLKFELRIDDGLLGFAVPSFVLQPLVENAIRHGIGRHKGNDVVTVRAFGEENRLHLEVSNRSSTLGDTPERLMQRGTGLANSKARVEQLYGGEHTLELRNAEPTGVCVTLSIPMRRLAPVEPLTAQEVAR